MVRWNDSFATCAYARYIEEKGRDIVAPRFVYVYLRDTCNYVAPPVGACFLPSQNRGPPSIVTRPPSLHSVSSKIRIYISPSRSFGERERLKRDALMILVRDILPFSLSLFPSSWARDNSKRREIDRFGLVAREIPYYLRKRWYSNNKTVGELLIKFIYIYISLNGDPFVSIFIFYFVGARNVDVEDLGKLGEKRFSFFFSFIIKKGIKISEKEDKILHWEAR